MICAVTSALAHQRLVRPPLLAAVRVLAFSVGIAEERATCRAGARPKSNPARTDTPSVNNRMALSGRASSGVFAVPCATNAMRARVAAKARASPNTPPESDSNSASSRLCRMMRPRLDPSARRVATSRCRAMARASRKLARLAHAIKSTTATIAIRILSESPYRERSPETPCAADTRRTLMCSISCCRAGAIEAPSPART